MFVFLSMFLPVLFFSDQFVCFYMLFFITLTNFQNNLTSWIPSFSYQFSWYYIIVYYRRNTLSYVSTLVLCWLHTYVGIAGLKTRAAEGFWLRKPPSEARPTNSSGRENIVIYNFLVEDKDQNQSAFVLSISTKSN